MDADFFAVLTRGGVWEISGGALADRPTPGSQNRVYLSFDEPTFYWDTGTSWVSVGASEDAAGILAKLLTVDTDGSGLNASTLRSLAPSDFTRNLGGVNSFKKGTVAERPASGQPGEFFFETDLGRLVEGNGMGWATRAVSRFEDLTSKNHKAQHVAGGVDALAPADIGAVRKAGDTAVTPFTLTRDPQAALEPATMQYVDAARAGLDLKPSVRLASNNNHALTGAQTVDGIAVVTGDRILLRAQTNAAENWIWIANTAGAWTRAPDSDSGPEVTPNAFAFVEEGTANADTGWTITTNGPITLGTTAIAVSQFSGPGSTTAGAGLVRSGNQLSADFGAAAGKVAQGNDVRLSDARSPTAHKASHTSGGTDALTPSDIQALGRVKDEGALLAYGSNLNLIGTGVVASKNATTGDIDVTISGAAAGLASQAAPGIAKSSVAPLVATNPIFVEDSDPRVSTSRVATLKRSANLSIVNQAWTLISWDVETTDDAGWFDPASPTILTLSEAGLYVVSFSSSFSATNAGVRSMRVIRTSAGVAVNEGEAPLILAGTDNFGRCARDSFFKALAGDTLHSEAFQNTGVALNFGANGVAGIPMPTLTVIRIK